MRLLDGGLGIVKKRIRWLLIFLLVVAVVGAIAYGASWLNSRRFYLVVGPTDVEIGKGRMFPFGWEPYRPDDPTLRRAYRGFDLPGGIKLARGTTIFTDRIELDQALFRLLTDAALFAMSRDTARSPDLVKDYLDRLDALPGVSMEQQVELQKLTKRAEYSRARQLVREAIELLTKAETAFDVSVGHLGPESAEAWSDLVHRTRASLLEGPPASRSVSSKPPVPTPPPPVPAPEVATGTTSTTSTKTE